MEKKLKKMFDYQQFEKNEKLEKMISETESRYAKELSDDDLSLVNAAGEMSSGKFEGNSANGEGGAIYFDSGGGGGGKGAGGKGTAM